MHRLNLIGMDGPINLATLTFGRIRIRSVCLAPRDRLNNREGQNPIIILLGLQKSVRCFPEIQLYIALIEALYINIEDPCVYKATTISAGPSLQFKFSLLAPVFNGLLLPIEIR